MELLNYILFYIGIGILVSYLIFAIRRNIRESKKEIEYNDYSKYLKNDAVLNFVSDRGKNFAKPTNEEDIINTAVLFAKNANYNKVIKETNYSINKNFQWKI